MSEKKDSVKLGKLEGALDYVEWKQSMKVYLRRNDFLLIGLRKSPENSDERGTADWNKAQIISKANIVLHMGSQPQVRTTEIIDDDEKAAYGLWTALESTYTRTNTQAV